MTSVIERIRERNRGRRLAAPASQSRRAALETFGLRYIEVDEFNVIVERDYQLNLAMSYWRAIDGSSQGYLVSALHAEVRRNHPISEKPAAGRDSGAADNGEMPSIDQATALAESEAGPRRHSGWGEHLVIEGGKGTVAFLPAVRP